MAKKRLKIHNKQGQEEAFDISVENVTLDSEGKTLGTKLAELEHDIEESGDGTYSKPPGGIPASDLAGDIPKDKLSQSVQTSLSKADTALQQETDPTVPAWAKASSPPAQVRSDWNQTNQNVASFIVNKPELAPVATSGDYNDLRNKPSIPEGADLSGLFANVSYNSTLKQISFLDKGNNVVGTLDASPFVRDGMVSNVSLDDGVLTITFNTDSGKTPIEVTLGDLFNTDNYYTKTDADGKFVVKDSGKGLSTNDYTDADQAKLQALPTADGLTQQLNSKANAADVAGIIEDNVSVEQPAAPDGTFTIHAGGNDYTINLNHTHEGMAKLEKHTPSTMPDVEDMEEDTIYAKVEDGEVSVLYIGGIPFYGLGSTLTPVLHEPADDSTIDVGKIASGESSVTKTIPIKGRHLTQALAVAVTGTGYSVDKQSIPAADANDGTTLTITCTNTDDNAAGTLSIASSEVSCDCSLVANKNPYQSLTSVKLTGTQWMDTGYRVKSNTILSATVLFGDKVADKGEGTVCFAMVGAVNEGTFYIWSTSASANQISASVGSGSGTLTQFLNHNPYGDVKNLVLGNSSFAILVNGTNISDSPKSTAVTPNFSVGSFCIGKAPSEKILSYYDLTIYNVKIYERNNGTDTLVRDYVPMLHEGVPGLYDSITDTFISSETTDELEYTV